MRLSLLLVALPFAVTTLVCAARHDDIPRKIKESIKEPPGGWHKHGPAPPDHLLELKIGLFQPHFPVLENHLLQVSDPDHERYGAYLSKEETEVLMSPHPESLDAVSEWLASYGIWEEHLSRSSAQDWVTVRVPVSLAEEMLNTKYDVYVHLDSGEKVVRTTSYSLPESLCKHVELIQPTTMFARLRSFKSTLHWANDVSESDSIPATGTIIGPAGNTVDASCNRTITISCIRQIYNAVGYNTSATNHNRIAVTSYINQYANNQDLQQFFHKENPAAYGFKYTFVSIKGGLNNQSRTAASMEANLDTQIAFGLTYPTPATLYSTGGSPPFVPDSVTQSNTNEPYLDWLDYVSSQEYLPQTISTSYGDDEQSVPKDYANRICAGFAALGVRGISLLFSSGDGGVGGILGKGCLSNDGTNRAIFPPVFPASCPYVTTVGGTHYIPETAVSFSGGGFSNYYPRPKYQDAAVRKYLKALAPGTYRGLYNPDGRGYPDVSAQAGSFLVVYKGRSEVVGGTSCSSPTFASLVSMLNDARMNAGKHPMGFLNPWLYAIGYAGLNDIATGNNPGCGTNGFNATVGWDPVTGLGTPNFEKLLALALDARPA